MTEIDFAGEAPEPREHPTRPFYWSVRREIWENRSLSVAPLIITAIVVFSMFLGTIGLSRRIQNLPTNDPVQRHATVVRPFSMAPAPIIFVTWIVGIFYALDALHGERRDRSILFWKSLPVSDRTTVLAKAAIPLAVLPLTGIVLGVLTQIVLMFWSSAVLAAHGVSPAILWSEFHFVQEPVVMFYGVFIHVLWFAPIYAWLLLVSAWARRTPLLWTVLPPLAIGIFERIVLRTTTFAELMKYRFTGAMIHGFSATPKPHGGIVDALWQLDPIGFLTTPGLWLGLLVAAACLAVAIRVRRNREPI